MHSVSLMREIPIVQHKAIVSRQRNAGTTMATTTTLVLLLCLSSVVFVVSINYIQFPHQLIDQRYVMSSPFYILTSLVSTFKYHVSCTDGKISVRINLLLYLFFHRHPIQQLCVSFLFSKFCLLALEKKNYNNQ